MTATTRYSKLADPTTETYNPYYAQWLNLCIFLYTISTHKYTSTLSFSIPVLYYSHNARYRGFGAEKYKQPFK